MKQFVTEKTLQKRGPAWRRRHGLALLLTITLLALLVLVLVSLATLVRVESTVSRATRLDAQARANALFALNLALGELQRTAGADQRVTAQANLEQVNVSTNPYWTGVWDTENPTGSPVWLVNPANGQNPFLDKPAPSDLTVEVIGFGDGSSDSGSVRRGPFPLTEPGTGGPNDALVIRLVKDNIAVSGVPGFGPSEERITGRYAWWVGDEGVKASLAAADRRESVQFDDGEFGDYTNLDTQSRLASLLLTGQRHEVALRRYPLSFTPTNQEEAGAQTAIAPDAFRDFSDPAVWPLLTGICQLRQYTHAIGTVQPSLDFSAARRLDRRLRMRYHDVTARTASVLADSARGGLRVHLDGMPGPGSAALNSGSVIDFSSLPGYAELRLLPEGTAPAQRWQTRMPIQPPSSPPEVLADGLVWTAAPVLVETGIDLEVSLRPVGIDEEEVILSIGVNTRLWNPYSTTLFLEGGPSGPGDALHLRIPLVAPDSNGNPIEIFPPISVLRGGLVAAEISLARSLGWDGLTNSFSYVVPLFSPGEEWLPGQSRAAGFTQSDLAQRSDGTAIRFPLPSESIAINRVGTDPPNLSILRLSLRSTLPGSSYDDLQVINNLDFGPHTNPAGATGFAFRVRLADGQDDRNWLQLSDPRSPVVDNSLIPAAYLTNSDPNASSPAPSFPGGSTFFDQPVILFEHPRQHQVSVGTLQHLVLVESGTGGPAYAVGTPFGTGLSGTVNQVFDRFFFSGMPRNIPNHDLRVNGPYANVTLVPVNRPVTGGGSYVDATRGPDAAAYLLASGTLNVNSTSETAWRAILGGVLPGNQFSWDSTNAEWRGAWSYRGNGGVETALLSNAFFRLPHTGQDLGEDLETWLPLPSNNVRRPTAAAMYRLGVRDLNKFEVNAIARGLVREIRAEVADMGRPFFSVEEFVNSGVLQRAIDTADLGSSRAINDGLDPYSTAWLSQNDILQLIAPRLFARSDTFVIRAYGEAGNPALDPTDARFTQARAYLEAVVQRMPMRHPRSTGPDMATADGFGRQFRIIGFRWLSVADL